MGITDTISQNLKAWMSADPYLKTIKQVEAKAKVGFGTVRRARKGEGNITVEKLEALARAFGRDPADLLKPPATNYAVVEEPQHPYCEPTKLSSGNRSRDARILSIVALLHQTDDYGLVAMLEKAKDVVRDYPRSTPGAQSS